MTSIFSSRLRYQVVEHTCGDYEVRLMGDYGDLKAGNRCSQCAHDRPEVPSYDSLYEAAKVAKRKNEEAGR